MHTSLLLPTSHHFLYKLSTFLLLLPSSPLSPFLFLSCALSFPLILSLCSLLSPRKFHIATSEVVPFRANQYPLVNTQTESTPYTFHNSAATHRPCTYQPTTMSADGSQNGGDAPRQRRGSITQAALSNLFQRGPPTGSSGPPFSGQPGTGLADPQRRRLSVTTLGLSGASASGASALGIRRGSMSTNSNNSDSIDESAIEEDDFSGAPRTAPTTPFVRRMSYGGSAMRGYRPAGSPGNGNPSPSSSSSASVRRPSGPSGRKDPISQGQNANMSATLAQRRGSIGMPTASFPQSSVAKPMRLSSDNSFRLDQQGFNWSEQLRSRAESTVASGPRPSFSAASSSPPRNGSMHHDRAKSISDLPLPPTQAPVARPAPQKPDAFQERILKGDFYMD